ncbi:MAG: hypothetical protein FJ399_09430 [Verrucomicrobia bacterium]|nr:hypothetical protein [Verrucomicrobiota bacterium]
MTSRARNPLSLPLTAAFVALAAAIVALPLIFIDRANWTTALFVRIGWTLVLLSLLWGTLSGLLARAVGWRAGVSASEGAAPALMVTVSAYCVVSFAAMVSHAMSEQTATANKIHWAAQIVAAVAAIVLVAMLSSARRLHDVDRPSATDIKDRDAIMLRVQATERRLAALNGTAPVAEAGEVLQSLRSLRDRIEKGLPPRTPSEKAAGFGALAERVELVCLRVDNTEPGSLAAATVRAALVSDVETLSAEVAALAREQRR